MANYLGSRRRINVKQKLFVAAYVKNPAATAEEVLRAAGYNPKNSKVAGAMVAMLFRRHPALKGEIQRKIDIAARRADVTLEKLLAELSLVAFARMDDYKPLLESEDPVAVLEELGSEQAAAIEQIIVDQDESRIEERNGKTVVVPGARRVKLKLHSKVDSLRLLATHMGMRTGRNFNMLLGSDGIAQSPNAERHAAREDLDCLSDDERGQLMGILDKIELARERRAQAPLIEAPEAALGNDAHAEPQESA